MRRVPAWMPDWLFGKPDVHCRSACTLKFDIAWQLWLSDGMPICCVPILSVQTFQNIPCLYVALQVIFEGSMACMTSEHNHVTLFRVFAHPVDLQRLKLMAQFLLDRMDLRGQAIFDDAWGYVGGFVSLHPHSKVFERVLDMFANQFPRVARGIDYSIELITDRGDIRMEIHPPTSVEPFSFRRIGPEEKVLERMVQHWEQVASSGMMVHPVIVRRMVLVNQHLAQLGHQEVGVSLWDES